LKIKAREPAYINKISNLWVYYEFRPVHTLATGNALLMSNWQLSKLAQSAKPVFAVCLRTNLGNLYGLLWRHLTMQLMT